MELVYQRNTIEVARITDAEHNTFLVQRAGNFFKKIGEAEFMNAILMPHAKEYKLYTVIWELDVDNPNIDELTAMTLANAILTLNRLGFKGAHNAPGNGPFDKAFRNIILYCTGEELIYE